MAGQDVFIPPLARALWRHDLRALPRWKAWIVYGLRVVYAVLRDAVEGSLALHATSLVYSTLLSLVPLLAISFSVLKAFGVHNRLEPVVRSALAPLGDKADEITNRIIGFVDKMEVGVLGAVGLALLVYTTIMVIQKIERAFNETWHIGQPRPLARKFADYMSVLLIAPVLIFSAIGMATSMQNSDFYQELQTLPGIGWLLVTLGEIMPALLLVAILAFVYLFMPNTSVRTRSALVGAAVAAALWLLVGEMFKEFVAGAGTYEAIYSAFATAILFILWLYVNWMIVLIGASIAFYHQHPEYVSVTGVPPRLSNRAAESLGLGLMASIGKAFYDGDPAPTVGALADKHNVPEDAAQYLINALESAGLLRPTTDDPPGYQPARALDHTPLKYVLDAVRDSSDGEVLPAEQVAETRVDAVTQRIEDAIGKALAPMTIKDLALTPRGRSPFEDDASGTEPEPAQDTENEREPESTLEKAGRALPEFAAPAAAEENGGRKRP
jgi:membrane protein